MNSPSNLRTISKIYLQLITVTPGSNTVMMLFPFSSRGIFVTIETSLSLPVKNKPFLFNSNFTPVKMLLGFLGEIALDTMFNAFNNCVFRTF